MASHSKELAEGIITGNMLSWDEDLGVNAILLEGILPKDAVDQAAMHADRGGITNLRICTWDFASRPVGSRVGSGDACWKAVASARRGGCDANRGLRRS